MKQFVSMLSIFFLVSTLQSNILEQILHTKELRVCIWPEYYGISYIDPRTQTLIGIDVDLAKVLAQSLDARVEFIPSSFATLIDDVTAHKCHIAMFAIGKTPARIEKLAFSTPHLASDIYAITTKSNPRIRSWDDIDKKGVIVAVAKGTLHVNIMQERLRHASVLIVDSLHAREQEVEAGRADVFMTDYPFGMRMIHEQEWARLLIPPKPFHITPYRWALPQNEPQWHERVDAFVDTINSNGVLLQTAKKYNLEPILYRELTP